jgi:hypothetical protein
LTIVGDAEAASFVDNSGFERTMSLIWNWQLVVVGEKYLFAYLCVAHATILFALRIVIK